MFVKWFYDFIYLHNLFILFFFFVFFKPSHFALGKLRWICNYSMITFMITFTITITIICNYYNYVYCNNWRWSLSNVLETRVVVRGHKMLFVCFWNSLILILIYVILIFCMQNAVLFTFTKTCRNTIIQDTTTIKIKYTQTYNKVII